MRAALRTILFVIAGIGATVSGMVLVICVDAAIHFGRFAPITLAYVAAAPALALTAAFLRLLIRPPLHGQRLQSHDDRAVDGIYLVGYFLIGATSTVELFAFGWPPLAAVTTALLILFAAAALAHRIGGDDTQPRWDGRCLICGYDLRGSTEPRCSECGTKFEIDKLPVRSIHDPR